MWNSFPPSVRTIDSDSSFSRALKTPLFQLAFNNCFYFLFCHFCRATLCVSAVFAVVLPSVRLSVTLVDGIQSAKDIVKLLSRPGSPVIVVFLTPNAGTLPRDPFSGDAKYNGVGKFLRFSTEIAVYLGNGTER